MSVFKAYLTSQEGKSVKTELVDMTVDQLDPGEVVIAVEYSTVNYKDALSATGAGRIIRRFPCIGGIDLAGTVESSSSPDFKPGDKVIAHSYDVGVAHHGGYAERARMPASWLVPIPSGMSTYDAMTHGTAGFTAAQAILRMQHDGLHSSMGPVLVNGATGGVGIVAIEILAKLGYHVVAVTGKEKDVELLKSIGAKDVLIRGQFEMTEKPLGSETYAGAVDNLGGEQLSWLTRVMKVGGTIASVGLAQGWEVKTTVMPFILRGVSLLGIDSVNCPMSLRRELWGKLANEWKCEKLASHCKTVSFTELPGVFEAYVKGAVTGRTVVKL
ncbi:MAG: acryloyl-CoA reductase [Burkholderiales bacterium]|nr:MAG: acryloyl-CoA reductase [Betaproteobacteria bacterium]TAG78600.1 MAG: acryloyl-CoA reductase [Burkholderiales bacterium]